MNTMQIWLAAARPKTLPISVGPVMLGTVLAFNEGSFNLFLFLMTLFTALGLQICANFANDYFDFVKGSDTEDRKGPLRVTQAGLIPLPVMKRALFIAFGITAVLGCFLVWHGGLVMAILVALSLLSAALYTAGPFPLAYLGLGDLFVFLFFGPIAVAGAYFLQTKHFSWVSVVVGIAAGALSTLPLVINNIRDREEDVKANKKTLVVRFGKFFGQLEYVICLLIGSSIPFLFLLKRPFCLFSLLFLIPVFPMVKAVFTYSDPRDLNKVLAKTGQVLMLYYALFCIGWGL
jgi:1,4-dihydroxy-2-naphthoate polyprenyltransferase